MQTVTKPVEVYSYISSNANRVSEWFAIHTIYVVWYHETLAEDSKLISTGLSLPHLWTVGLRGAPSVTCLRTPLLGRSLIHHY
jgi:hypothetical protein